MYDGSGHLHKEEVIGFLKVAVSSCVGEVPVYFVRTKCDLPLREENKDVLAAAIAAVPELVCRACKACLEKTERERIVFYTCLRCFLYDRPCASRCT